MIPQIVIVGRPNVGKSTLFNWLVGKRIAIEDPTAGVTRDRLVQRIELDDRVVELIDTGGMGFDDPDGLSAQIDAQIEIGLAAAAAILFVVDVRSGLVPADKEVARRVRRAGAPVILVANKADAPGLDAGAADFATLGFGEPLLVSAHQHRNRGALEEAILPLLPPPQADDPESAELPEMKLAMVGRRNVGKSTFVNALAHEERVITSPVAGTTRDSVDVRFEVDGNGFLAIDTPGLRRAKSRTTDIDFYAFHRAQRSIRRADVVLLFFDATDPIGKVDKQLAETITEDAKPVVFVVNKWDLYAGDVKKREWTKYLRDTFRTMPWAPVAFVTSTKSRNVKATIDTAQRLYRQSHTRVPTPKLNDVLREAVEANRPSPDGRGRPVRLYFATQVEVGPPTIVISASAPRAITEPYKRYLAGVFQKRLPFREVPIRLLLRGKKSSEATS
jgi:GTP-binding protein